MSGPKVVEAHSVLIEPVSLEGKDIEASYQAAGKIVQEELKKNETLADQFAFLAKLKPLVVRGQHDRIERIFSSLQLDFTPARSLDDIANVPLQPQQAIFINCGKFPKPSSKTKRVVEEHVRAGGVLITTDWCLQYVIPHLFPGYIKYNGNRTDPRNESFPIELVEGNQPAGNWFVESSSHPLGILKPGEVRPIFRSLEFGQKYHCDPALCVTFPIKDGAVFHYVSHLYAQMVELREQEDRQNSACFAAQQGIDPKVLGDLGSRTTTGGVRSALSTLHSTIRVATSTAFPEKTTENSPLIRPTDRFKLIATMPVFYDPVAQRREREYLIEGLARNLILGRDTNVDVHIVHPSISRRHAELQPRENRVELQDLQSLNGTYRNGQVLNSWEALQYNDQLAFGKDVALRVERA